MHADGWHALGLAEREAGRDDQAIAAFRKAVEIRPDHAEAHLSLGMALMSRENFADGLQHHEARLMSRRLGIAAGRPNLPLWRGGDPEGLAILLLAEQEVGDVFQFARYARWLKERGAARVVIGCSRRIAHLIATVPGVDAVIGEGDELPAVHAMAHMMSMPLLTGLRGDSIPAYECYMRADTARVDRWAGWLAGRPGFRVGIAWQAVADPRTDRGRSVPLSALAPLARIPDIRLISLQKGHGEAQIAALAGDFAVERPGPGFDGGPDAFADVAAMIMNLDLVITADTAVAHLAGALGRPCWVILGPNPDWRWLTGRADSPWYPDMRLFRRARGEAEATPFAGVIGRVADALARCLTGVSSGLPMATEAESVVVPPFDPAAVFDSALKAYRAADHATAARLFGQVLDIARFQPAAFNLLGTIALHAERDHRAVIFFRAAEQAGPQSAEFLTNHAIGLRRIRDMPQAIARLDRVVAMAPTPEAHLTLANIHRDECNFDLSLANYRAALALKPDFAKAHRGIGNLMRDMHRPEEALAAFARARERAPEDPDLILDHAHAKLFAGDLVGGFRDYEARWHSRETRPRHFSEPRWHGEEAPGKVLLIHGEQGFGDNIQFVRFVDEAARRVGRVVLEVRGPLVDLMKRLETDRPVTVVEQGAAAGRFDVQIPLLSLPAAFGTTLDTIPPPSRFRLDPERVRGWRERFATDGATVGLVWQGNPRARADAGRSPPFSVLAPLFSLPDTRFVALQKTDGLEQLRRSVFRDRIVAPGEALGDFCETAHAIAALDVVVSSCTATLHLAASLGVPVYGMLKYHADWRWLNERETSPWYPSLRLFRQRHPHEWEPVAAAIRAALAERMVAP